MSEAVKQYLKSLGIVLAILVIGSVLDATLKIEGLDFNAGAAFIAGMFWGRQYP
jgi:hypothetical protein